ncbi:MAG: hypothetical protein AAGA96_04925 [Verrucomicrobiota bacterium]
MRNPLHSPSPRSLGKPWTIGLTIIAVFLCPRLSNAEEPRVFIELGKGISYAKEGNRLVLFLLVESFADETDAIVEAINQELIQRGNEFVIIRCQNESADHRTLFEDRFKQDPDKMPLGVVATSAGDVVIGTNGKSPDAYRIMIQAARIQSGLEKDPDKIASLQAAIASDEDAASTVFGLKRSDVEVKKELLTDYRDWNFQNGTVVNAALLEAKGQTGIFVTTDGKEQELNFNDLSPEDITFLQSILASN